jgi:hypothetical protein
MSEVQRPTSNVQNPVAYVNREFVEVVHIRLWIFDFGHNLKSKIKNELFSIDESDLSAYSAAT